MAMTYGEMLKDPRWQKKRLTILNRDNWMCQHCHSTAKTLHVHHKTYVYGKEPWDYVDENFLTLCAECHESEEYYKTDVANLIHDLLISGNSYHNISDSIRERLIHLFY